MKMMKPISKIGLGVAVLMACSVLASAESSGLSRYIENITSILKDAGNSLGVLFLTIQGIRILVESDPNKRLDLRSQHLIIVAALGLINLAGVIVQQILSAT